MLIGMNVRNIRSFRLPFCRLEAERRPHREAGILVSRMFPALLLILFVLKQIADLGQQLHVGGGSCRCGRFLFLFLLQFAQQADQQEDRERDNQKVQRGLQKVAEVDRDGRLYDLASRRENRFFERDLEIGEVDSPRSTVRSEA